MEDNGVMAMAADEHRKMNMAGKLKERAEWKVDQERDKMKTESKGQI